MNQMPGDCHYRWPAEFERHTASWVAWPHNRATWPGRFEGVLDQFVQFVWTLAEFEPVHVLAGAPALFEQAQGMLGCRANIQLHAIATDDAWVRDYGPMFVTCERDTRLAIIDWDYNAWGGKYPAWKLDAAVPQQVAGKLGLPRFAPGCVLEGGSIDGNGAGWILTTESCLLAANRNPDRSRLEIECCLAEYCGASQVIWLPGQPLAGDDTDGHVDQVARFIGPEQLVVSIEEDPEDENYVPLHQNLQFLESWPIRESQSFDITCLPLPAAQLIQGQRVPASYCNFYLANGCALVPQFGDARDAQAIERLQRALPDRQVLGLPADRLVWGLGAFHCLTQQQPAVRSQETPPSPLA